MGLLTGDLGSQVRVIRSATGFSRIALDGIGRVRITHADREEVEVEAPERLMEHIEVFVEGETLHLRLRSGLRLHHVGRLDLRFEVRAKRIGHLQIDGAGRIEADRLSGREIGISVDGAGRIDIDRAETEDASFSIDGAGRVALHALAARKVVARVDGAGKIDLDRLECQRLETRVDGAGKLSAAGTADDARIRVDGAGRLRLGRVESRRASVEIAGTGSVELSASETLAVRIDGFGRVAYHGRPELDVRTGGFGKVLSLDAP